MNILEKDNLMKLILEYGDDRACATDMANIGTQDQMDIADDECKKNYR